MLSLPRSLALPMGNTHLDYARFGSGQKALVILPGLSLRGVKGAALPLAYLYREFARDYTVYVLDKKADIPSGCTIRDLAEDAAQAMERLHLPAADVFGVSQGGMVAQYLAIYHPQRVRRLALGVAAARCNGLMRDVLARWIDWAERDRYPDLIVDMMERMYSPGYVKKYRWLFPLLSRMGRPKDSGRFITLARACLTCEAYPELHKIRCPVLVLGGKEDRVLTGQASEEIAAALRCESFLYDGLGHAAYDEAPDFNSRILRFLQAGG